MTLVMFPSKKKKKNKRREKNKKYSEYTNSATLKKREKIMPIHPNDAKYYAGIIYKGLHLDYKR